MFGFSISKLLVLAVVLAVVVYGFKLLSRANAAPRQAEDDSASTSRIDTVYDPETDTYVPKGTGKNSNKN